MNTETTPTTVRPHVADPRMLVSQYRLAIKPQLKTKVKVERAQRSGSKEPEASGVKSAIPVNYHTWRLDSLDDDSDLEREEVDVSEEDFLNTLEPSLDPSQQTYLDACKNLRVVPLNGFQRSLKTPRVHMKNQLLEQPQIKAMAIALTKNCHVETLSLEANNLKAEGTSCIAAFLPNKSEITELSIVDNKLGERGAEIICNALLCNTRVRKMNLSGNDFADSSAPFFKELLEENIALRDLNLSHNNFREEGGVILAQGLANNDFLQALNLSWNNLRMDGASAIGESLKVNHILEVLNLGWNGFHLRGCQALGQALETNRSLVELDLSCNRVNPVCLAQLLKYLSSNDTLKVLRLPLNPLYPEGAMSMLKLLERHEGITLTHVDLGKQCVFDEFISLLEELKKTRPLTVIHGPVIRNKYSINVTHDRKSIEDDEDSEIPEEDLLDELPFYVLMEYMRQQNFRLVDMFKILDKDNGKSVSRDEFRTGLKQVGIPMTDRALENLIDMLDVDGNDEVDFNELLKGYDVYRNSLRDTLARGDYPSSDFARVERKVRGIMKKRYLQRQFTSSLLTLGGDKADKTDKAEKKDKTTDKTDKTDETDKTDKTDKMLKTDETDETDETDKTDLTDKTDKTD